MIDRQVNDAGVGQDSHEIRMDVLEVGIPVVVDPEKAALQQTVAHANGLVGSEVVVRRILHFYEWTPEEVGIHGGDVRKAGVAVVPPADSRFGQLGETHHQVEVCLRVVVAPPGLSRSADVLVASPIASASATANSVHRAHAGVLRMRGWYNGEGSRS